jgi:hypothetical protein
MLERAAKAVDEARALIKAAIILREEIPDRLGPGGRASMTTATPPLQEPPLAPIRRRMSLSERLVYAAVGLATAVALAWLCTLLP